MKEAVHAHMDIFDRHALRHLHFHTQHFGETWERIIQRNACPRAAVHSAAHISAHEHPHKQNQNPNGLITQQGALHQNERTLSVYCYSSVVTAHFLAVTPQKQPYFSQLPLNALHRCNRYTLLSPNPSPQLPLAFQLAFPLSLLISCPCANCWMTLRRWGKQGERGLRGWGAESIRYARIHIA